MNGSTSQLAAANLPCKVTKWNRKKLPILLNLLEVRTLKTVLYWWTYKDLSIFRNVAFSLPREVFLSLHPPHSDEYIYPLSLFIIINIEHLAATKYRAGTCIQPTSCDEGKAPSQVTQYFRWAGLPVPQVRQITFSLKTEKKTYMFLWANTAEKSPGSLLSYSASSEPYFNTQPLILDWFRNYDNINRVRQINIILKETKPKINKLKNSIHWVFCTHYVWAIIFFSVENLIVSRLSISWLEQ